MNQEQNEEQKKQGRPAKKSELKLYENGLPDEFQKKCNEILADGWRLYSVAYPHSYGDKYKAVFVRGL